MMGRLVLVNDTSLCGFSFFFSTPGAESGIERLRVFVLCGGY